MNRKEEYDDFEQNKTPCSKCMIYTISIKKNKAKYLCKICNHNKTISDIYFLEIV